MRDSKLEQIATPANVHALRFVIVRPIVKMSCNIGCLFYTPRFICLQNYRPTLKDPGKATAESLPIPRRNIVEQMQIENIPNKTQTETRPLETRTL